MSKDIKKALEHCIEWNCVDCPNREELGSGETVCRGRLLTDVLEYVADLEVKLAERTKQLKIALKDFNDIQQENDKLAQQLAEKDKEIEKYRNANMIVVGERSQGKKHLMKIKIKELQNQKAIEQLEEVKENAWQSATDISCLLDYTELAKIIDNQIKELKGENK